MPAKLMYVINRVEITDRKRGDHNRLTHALELNWKKWGHIVVFDLHPDVTGGRPQTCSTDVLGHARSAFLCSDAYRPDRPRCGPTWPPSPPVIASQLEPGGSSVQH